MEPLQFLTPSSGSKVEKLLDSIKADYKVAIELKNYTRYTLSYAGLHLTIGSGNMRLAQQIASLSAGAYSAPKSGSLSEGTAGVFSYYIEDADKTVHVMWCVPQESPKLANAWNVLVEDGKKETADDDFERLYKLKRDTGKEIVTVGPDFEVVGYMKIIEKDNSVGATLVVELKGAVVEKF